MSCTVEVSKTYSCANPERTRQLDRESLGLDETSVLDDVTPTIAAGEVGTFILNFREDADQRGSCSFYIHAPGGYRLLKNYHYHDDSSEEWETPLLDSRSAIS